MFLHDLERYKIVAILRGVSEEQGIRTMEALWEGGIRFAEVTLNTPGWAHILSSWRAKHDSKMWIGTGTVLNIEMAKEAYMAGAQFLVSPNVDLAVIDYARTHDLPIICGAMTPTEIVTAWQAGVTAIKLFPVSSLGLQYFKEIRAPLDQIRMLPTGGIDSGNIGDYLQAGSFGFGVGSGLMDKDAIMTGRYDEIRDKALSLNAAMRKAMK